MRMTLSFLFFLLDSLRHSLLIHFRLALSSPCHLHWPCDSPASTASVFIFFHVRPKTDFFSSSFFFLSSSSSTPPPSFEGQTDKVLLRNKGTASYCRKASGEGVAPSCPCTISFRMTAEN